MIRRDKIDLESWSNYNKMDFDKYIDLIENEEYENAVKYKNSFIPDKLYKYYWLDDNDNNNKLRLDTLSNNQLYLSPIADFNDPFEGKAFKFNNNELLNKGWNREIIDYFMDRLNTSERVCCLTNVKEKQNNMPMWAYYSNNHNGFCVEYEIREEQKMFIYPVIYEETRLPGNFLLTSLINGIVKMIKNGQSIDEMSGRISMLNHMAYLSLTVKHKSWSHENEYRILSPEGGGNYFSAIPHKVYIGMNCKEVYRNRLVEIGRALKGYCQVFQMQCDKENSGYYLTEKKLV